MLSKHDIYVPVWENRPIMQVKITYSAFLFSTMYVGGYYLKVIIINHSMI